MSTLCLLHQARHSWSSSIGCKWQLAGKTDAAAFLAYLFAVMLLLMLPQQCTSIPFHCEWCCWILYFILLFIYHLSSLFSQCQCSSDMQSVFVCLSIWKRGFLKFKWQLCKVKKCIYIPHLHSFTYLVTSRDSKLWRWWYPWVLSSVLKIGGHFSVYTKWLTGFENDDVQ